MTSRFSRRTALKTAGGGAALTAALGIMPRYIRPARAAEGYAPGMTGGPTGFPGAERFQYNEEMSEGRAIEGMKQLKAAGKTPEKISILLSDGAIGQLTEPLPAGAPTVQEIWEKETGVGLEIVGASSTDIWKKVLQDVTTRSGAFDIYTHPWNSVGDLVEAGGAYPLNDFVEKYRPDWGDPERGTPTPEIEDLLYKYKGNYYSVSLDGDFQTWVYNRWAYENPEFQKAFSDQHGYQLGPPRTWEECDAISAFLTGKTGMTGQKMYGNGNMLSPFWGLSIFYGRLASMANPNFYWFDDDAKPRLNSEECIQCATEHLAMMQWSHPDILSWGYAEAYSGMSNGLTGQISTYTNLAKFNDRIKPDGTKMTPISGELGAYLPPGRLYGDDLIRRSVIYYNINADVSANSQYPEAAYLFLQWLSSTRTFSWMSGNPSGYFDPFQVANFNEPLVIETYHDYLVPVIQETIRRSAPTLNFAGQTALDNALDEEIQAMLTGQKSPKEAMDNAQSRWERIIRRRGSEEMEEAIHKSRFAWPTVIDKA